MTQQSIIHLVVNWKVFTINYYDSVRTHNSSLSTTVKLLHGTLVTAFLCYFLLLFH